VKPHSGLKFRLAREAKLMPQQDAARDARINQTYLSQFERGRRELPEEAVRRLEQAIARYKGGR
jgi:transcriptional regulator with XRE-family HTH domain